MLRHRNMWVLAKPCQFASSTTTVRNYLSSACVTGLAAIQDAAPAPSHHMRVVLNCLLHSSSPTAALIGALLGACRCLLLLQRQVPMQGSVLEALLHLPPLGPACGGSHQEARRHHVMQASASQELRPARWPLRWAAWPS